MKYIILFSISVCLGGCLNGNISTSSTASFHEAYQFNGISSSVNVLATSQPFTIMTVEMYFQTTSAANQYLFSSNFPGLFISMNAGIVGFSSPNAGACTGIFGVQTAPSLYNDGAVHHLAAIFNTSASPHYLYVDGILVKTFTPSAYAGCTMSNLYIGSNTFATNWFSGIIDDVRISNISRYGGSFTVPHSPAVGDNNVLDLFHFDNSNNGSSDYFFGGGSVSTPNVSSVTSPVKF